MHLGTSSSSSSSSKKNGMEIDGKQIPQEKELKLDEIFEKIRKLKSDEHELQNLLQLINVMDNVNAEIESGPFAGFKPVVLAAISNSAKLMSAVFKKNPALNVTVPAKYLELQDFSVLELCAYFGSDKALEVILKGLRLSPGKGSLLCEHRIKNESFKNPFEDHDALMIASHYGYASCVRLLLSIGAQPYAKKTHNDNKSDIPSLSLIVTRRQQLPKENEDQKEKLRECFRIIVNSISRVKLLPQNVYVRLRKLCEEAGDEELMNEFKLSNYFLKSPESPEQNVRVLPHRNSRKPRRPFKSETPSPTTETDDMSSEPETEPLKLPLPKPHPAAADTQKEFSYDAGMSSLLNGAQLPTFVFGSQEPLESFDDTNRSPFHMSGIDGHEGAPMERESARKLVKPPNIGLPVQQPSAELTKAVSANTQTSFSHSGSATLAPAKLSRLNLTFGSNEPDPSVDSSAGIPSKGKGGPQFFWRGPLSNAPSVGGAKRKRKRDDDYVEFDSDDERRKERDDPDYDPGCDSGAERRAPKRTVHKRHKKKAKIISASPIEVNEGTTETKATSSATGDDQPLLTLAELIEQGLLSLPPAPAPVEVLADAKQEREESSSSSNSHRGGLQFFPIIPIPKNPYREAKEAEMMKRLSIHAERITLLVRLHDLPRTPENLGKIHLLQPEVFEEHRQLAAYFAQQKRRDLMQQVSLKLTTLFRQAQVVTMTPVKLSDMHLPVVQLQL